MVYCHDGCICVVVGVDIAGAVGIGVDIADVFICVDDDDVYDIGVCSRVVVFVYVVDDDGVAFC